jgi:ATP-binding cassette subfamily B protein
MFIFSEVFSLLVNYQLKEIIDTVQLDKSASVSISILLFTLYTFMWHGSFWIVRLFQTKYMPEILQQVILDMYLKVMKQSLHWFDSHMSGEISAKISDFQDGVSNSIKWVFLTINDIAVVVLSLGFLFMINHTVALFMLIFMVIFAPILLILLKKQLVLLENLVEARQKATGIINDSISNIFSVKILGKVASEIKYNLFPQILNWKNSDRAARKYDTYFVDSTDTILQTLMYLGLITLLTYLYKIDEITSGDFAAITLTAFSAQKSLDSLIERAVFDLSPKIALLKSCYSFIDAPADIYDKPNSRSFAEVKGRIEYRNVSFNYGNEKIIFDNLNLSIKSGEKIGIVGTSGAGKTTFVKCLLRYFNIKGGTILVDDQDISEITQESLRENISIIPQDISMFHRTILENLRVAKAEATFEEIVQACVKANIHEDIMSMEHGYDSIVGERGVKMSGGQRQRIAIARAILKNAPILILDEATSALDSPTEKLIQQSINVMLDDNKSTTIVIAHRLSTLLNMDRILVFEKGKIMQEGTHKELISAEGIYKKLWQAQTGDFLN